MLKEVAALVERIHPARSIRFLNDKANDRAEDYGLRAAEMNGTCIIVDDAHRLENLRPRLLRRVCESQDAGLLIAARPNALEPLTARLLEAGFADGDWQVHALPQLDHSARYELALELLGDDRVPEANWLAGESAGCLLVCTAGANLINAGRHPQALLNTPEFKRRVFDHLLQSNLLTMCGDDAPLRRLAECVLRVIALAGPLDRTDDLAKTLAGILSCPAADADMLLSQLECAGLLRFARGRVRVVPDLLADHLAYDTACGVAKLPSLVQDTITALGDRALPTVFGNLAEAEWRACQEGDAGSYLDGIWQDIRGRLADPEDTRVTALLNSWSKFSVFQPTRTLEMARMLLDHETARVRDDLPMTHYGGYRIDPLFIRLEALPNLLAPVACHRSKQRGVQGKLPAHREMSRHSCRYPQPLFGPAAAPRGVAGFVLRGYGCGEYERPEQTAASARRDSAGFGFSTR